MDPERHCFDSVAGVARFRMSNFGPTLYVAQFEFSYTLTPRVEPTLCNVRQNPTTGGQACQVQVSDW